jgi:hypothetical protein
MICAEVAEYVSALCDREIIPSSAAEHIGVCSDCQALLRDYLDLGAELRRTASLEQLAPAPVRVWTNSNNPLNSLIQKGWQTMRIPRVAFAALIAGIVVLASTLAIVKVGAHSTGTVVLLSVAGPNGPLSDCPLSTLEKRWSRCAMMGGFNGQTIGYQIDLVKHDANRVQLGIRTKVFGKADSSSSSDIQSEPQKLVWFKPGEPLKLDFSGVVTLTFKGEWMDHIPALVGMSSRSIDPQPDEVRVTSPLILKDRKVVGDCEGANARTNKTNQGIRIYVPGEGLFVLSLLPMPGAVQAEVRQSRISFAEGTHSYIVLTGAPVTRSDHLWVLREKGFKPNPDTDQPILGSIDMDKFPPDSPLP